MENNITMTPYPYDSSMDLQKSMSTTWGKDTINVTYTYNESKDLNKSVQDSSALNELEYSDGYFWLCPQCHELNYTVNGPCFKCGYVRTIKC